jgi:isopentenyldiphosphate isomerase
MSKPRVIIVNDQDEIIGYKERGTVQLEDIYRVSALWVTNSQGDILLAQRSFNKKHHPGGWGPAVAGTVDEDESYEENIIKEATEEVGLKDIKPQKSKKVRVTLATGDHNHFTQWFTLVVDKPLKTLPSSRKKLSRLDGLSGMSY